MFLTSPKAEYLSSFIVFCIEFKKNALNDFFLSEYSVEDLENLSDERRGGILTKLDELTRAEISDSLVPDSQFWLVDGDEVVGVGDIRHCLTPALEFFGGHIGYGVKIGRWGKGIGAILLAELLKQAQSFGIKTALLTCHELNTGSQHVIEKNGGIWLDSVGHEVNGALRSARRYLVDTGLAFQEKIPLNHSLLYQTENGGRLTLLPKKTVDECGCITSYYFNIIFDNDIVGWIVFRAGDDSWLYYDGNLGYYINSEYRNRGFAEDACRLMGGKLKQLGINSIKITCDSDNAPSRRICQKLGAKFLEIAQRTGKEGKKIKCRYLWERF